MRHQHVQEVERRRGVRALRLERRDEAVEVLQAPDVEGVQVHLRQRLALELAAGVGAEVPPRLVDRRQLPLERRRRDEVQVDDSRVRVERRETRPDARRLAVADLRGAQPRLRLRDLHPVAVREQREEVVRVVLRDGYRAGDRRIAGQDHRDGDGRGRRKRGRVAEPRRRPRESREVREALRIDVPVRLEQVVDRELVEEQVDDRRRGRDRRSARVDRLRKHELLDLRIEEKGDEEDQRRAGEDRQKRPHEGHTPGRDGERDADRNRAGDQEERAVDVAPLERLHAEDRGEKAEEHVVEHDGIASRDELDDDLDREQQERRHERDGEREEDDVAGRRAAHGEELGVLAEDVEERLRERKARDGEQLSTANRRARARTAEHSSR